MRKVWTVVFVATTGFGCVDYQFNGQKGEEEEAEENETDSPAWDTGALEQEEICNGIDDNDNGQIDEGFPDYDLDGIADCTDDNCDLWIPSSGTVMENEDCSGKEGPKHDPWDVYSEWHWSGVSSAPEFRNVMGTPIVGNLTDDDGDGDIDEWDTPDVLVVAAGDGLGMLLPSYLVVIDGVTGLEQWASFGVSAMIQPAIVDVEGDGWPEILVGTNGGKNLSLLDFEGTEIWSTPVSGALYPIITDFEGDGLADIVYGPNIIDATTGTIKQHIDSAYSLFPVVGDIDQDGTAEVLYSDGAWTVTGSQKWSNGLPGPSNYPMIIDVDGDPEGEVIYLSPGSISVFDDDGTLLWDAATESSAPPWPPCAADFDGDGDVDIGWGDKNVFQVYDTDGTKLWSSWTVDTSGSASCSAFDFDGNGSYEVVYADEDYFWIFDGQTGNPLFKDSGHASGTLVEYPVIVDVDGDGSAEIISPSMNQIPFFSKLGGIGGVTSYGHVDNEWAGAGSSWNAHDFASTNYNADGTVFGTTPSWQTDNMFHGRPPLGLSSTDLSVTISDVCASSCGESGVVHVAVQVSNEGYLDSISDVPISLYADNGGVLQWIDEQVIPGSILSGTSASGIDFAFPSEDYGSNGVVARVSESWSLLQDCTETNNSDAWTEQVCP